MFYGSPGFAWASWAKSEKPLCCLGFKIQVIALIFDTFSVWGGPAVFCQKPLSVWLGSFLTRIWPTAAIKAVFRHDLWVKSRKLATEFIQSLPLTHAQREVFTTAPNLPYSLRERWSSRVQQTEAGSDVLTLLRGSHDLLDNTQTSVLALITTHNIFHCVFCRCITALSPGEICFLFLWRALEASSTPPPPHSRWIQRGIPCCVHTSHVSLWHLRSHMHLLLQSSVHPQSNPQSMLLPLPCFTILMV